MLQPWAGNWLCRDAATLRTRATSGGRGKKGRGFFPSSPAKPTRSREPRPQASVRVQSGRGQQGARAYLSHCPV